ncbi:MAG TPA: hypothetical protein VM324_08565 [Egibacteraceae bacterium]|nr:hypothetical protein [Egibacteraceae bacterium]
MSFARPIRDPLDAAREALAAATAHLEWIRQRVQAGQLTGQALTMAELRRHHAQQRFTSLLRGDGDSAA